MIITRDSYRSAPWKNGRGTTFEIVDSGDVAPHWRLSLAMISGEGVFSDFSGYDRTIVKLAGGGLTIAFDGGGSEKLCVLTPRSFAGERRVKYCVTDGPVQAINVMTLRGSYVHTVQVVPGAPIPPAARERSQTFLYVLEGRNAGDTLRLHGVSTSRNLPSGIYVVIRSLTA
ncbi:MAG TPA: HutD family protein [Candidatus Baltobacteraceae bacterium]